MTYFVLAFLLYVACFATSDIIASWVRRSKADLVENNSIYARKGETVTCENGHPICDLAETVYVGEQSNLTRQLINWRQDVPQIGGAWPRCTICGKDFCRNTRLHFADGWRTRRNDELTPITKSWF